MEKKLSQAVVKELKYQESLKPSDRTWIMDPLVVDGFDRHAIFSIGVPKLVRFRQFLTAVQVATLTIADFKVSIELTNIFNDSEFNQKIDAIIKENIKNQDKIDLAKPMLEFKKLAESLVNDPEKKSTIELEAKNKQLDLRRNVQRYLPEKTLRHIIEDQSF